MKKDFLTLRDHSSETLMNIIKFAIKMKNERRCGIKHNYLEGKKVALIFEKSSTRTRVSFEVGVYEMGGFPLFLSKNDIQLGRGETIQDTARTLSRYVDMMMIRTFEHKKAVDLAKNSSVPVINGLTDDFHPCQVMADVMTIYEIFGRFNGVKVAYIGDGNNMANSWLYGAAKLGIDFSIASPAGYQCEQSLIEEVRSIASSNGSSIIATDDPYKAAENADVIYTDVWASMGQEGDAENRVKAFENYQVDSKLMISTGKKTYFMHCLPAHRGEEVSGEVIESSDSIVFDQAENRLHAQKAIMAYLADENNIIM